MSDDAGPPGPSSPSEPSGYPATPTGAYESARQLHGPDEPTSVEAWPGGPLVPNVIGPATQSVYDYLEGLKGGLAERARREGWRVASSIRGRPYLLVPDRAGGGHTVVRGYRLRAIEEAGASQAPPYVDSAWVDRGAPRWTDVPVPFFPGTLDRKVVWVSRDPADALLLGSLGLTAVSLVAPCETLGAEDMMRRLVELGALDPKKPRRRAVVVVDPEGTLGDERGGLLCGLFDHVWEVRPAGGDTGPGSVTGRGLAALVGTCTYPGSNPVEDLEALLLERVEEVGRRCGGTPVPLYREPGSSKAGGRVPPSDRVARPETDGPPLVSVKPRMADEIMAAGSDWAEWVVEPFASPGRFTDVQGDTQIGKTSFLLALASAVTEGADFLGKPSTPSPVVYVTEQSDVEFKDNLSQVTGETSGFRFLTSDDHLGMSLPQLVAHVRGLCRESGARLVVFDTVYDVAGMTGGQSRTDGRIRELFQTLRPLVTDGAAVVLVRHGVDGGGSLSTTGAGSRAFNGKVSTSVRFRKARSGENHRSLEVESRKLGKLELLVSRAPMGRYELVGPNVGGERAASEDGDLSGLELAVLRALEGVDPPGLRSTEVVRRLANAQGLGPGRFVVDKALAGLVEKMRVVREGDGVRRSPFRYLLAPA